MNKHASKVPLQAMISRAIAASTEKTASDNRSTEQKVQSHLSYERPAPVVVEKLASANIDDEWVEKLAQSVDWIASNMDQVDFPRQGILEKAAEEGSPQGPGKGPGSLEVDKSMDGQQSHKKDKPSGPDAAASTAGKGLSAARPGDSKTQLDNDMHHAPGGGSVAPTGHYPDKGPLVAGPSTKTAELKAALLRKLAGEDVMKASIGAEGGSNPLAGMGGLTTTDASESSPGQSGDPVSNFGNQARKLIASNQAAIDATKGAAKGPVKTQLGELIDEPALSSSSDSTLEQNLRNTGKAGVKIAAARNTLEKIAAAGCTCVTIDRQCAFCSLQQKLAAAKGKGSEKRANMMGAGGGAMGASAGGGMGGGGGMAAMAQAGAGADGCTCAGTGECKVCKLKAALAAVKAQGQMPGDAAGGVPVEKDSTMGMGPANSGGIY